MVSNVIAEKIRGACIEETEVLSVNYENQFLPLAANTFTLFSVNSANLYDLLC